MNTRKSLLRVKRNKGNTKKVILLLMRRSSIDFTPEHCEHKLYRVGWEVSYNIGKLMFELCDDTNLVFSGYCPEKVHGSIVGYQPVFTFIRGGKHAQN